MMFGDCVAPMSTVTARELLLPLLPESEPDLATAADISAALMTERGMYVTATFILDVWAWRDQHGQY